MEKNRAIFNEDRSVLHHSPHYYIPVPDIIHILLHLPIIILLSFTNSDKKNKKKIINKIIK